MKFFKPLGLIKKKTATAKPTSFGERRSYQMSQSLAKAQEERKKLVQKEYMSPDPLNKIYQKKGHQLDVKIRKLKDEMG